MKIKTKNKKKHIQQQKFNPITNPFNNNFRKMED